MAPVPLRPQRVLCGPAARLHSPNCPGATVLASVLAALLGTIRWVFATNTTNTTAPVLRSPVEVDPGAQLRAKGYEW